MVKPIAPRIAILRQWVPSTVPESFLPTILDELDAVPDRGELDWKNFYGEPDEAEVMARLIKLACPVVCNRETDADGNPAGWHKACEVKARAAMAVLRGE